MFGRKEKMNGVDIAKGGAAVKPECHFCNDQGQVYDAGGVEGQRIVPCPGCGENVPAGLRREMTMGGYLVGADFNPAGKAEVGTLKNETAIILDRLHEFVLAQMDEGGNDAAGRCAAIAMQKYEEACMWGVKALTKDPI